MEKLELGFLEEIDAGSDEEMPDDTVECVDEVLGNTILDKMMEDWVGGTEDVLNEVTMQDDECLNDGGGEEYVCTVQCAGSGDISTCRGMRGSVNMVNMEDIQSTSMSVSMSVQMMNVQNVPKV